MVKKMCKKHAKWRLFACFLHTFCTFFYDFASYFLPFSTKMHPFSGCTAPINRQSAPNQKDNMHPISHPFHAKPSFWGAAEESQPPLTPLLCHSQRPTGAWESVINRRIIVITRRAKARRGDPNIQNRHSERKRRISTSPFQKLPF